MTRKPPSKLYTKALFALLAATTLVANSGETSLFAIERGTTFSPQKGSLIVQAKGAEVVRIDMETGQIFWNKREVETDEEYRKVMVELAKGLWAKPCETP